MPLITVGIPVYNASQTVSTAIQSVLQQTFTDFELIITDDGSTDNTLSIINTFADPRIRVVSHTENKGIAFRLNEQIEMAEGQYFARMDADDIMMPERLERQVKALLDNKDIDVLGTAIVVIDESCSIIGQRGTVCAPPRVSDANYFFHPTVMGRIEWFRNNHYNPAYSGWEDYELWLRTCSKSKFMEITEPLLFYRDPLSFDVKKTIHRHWVGCRVMLQQMNQYESFLAFVRALITSCLSCLLIPCIHLFNLDKLIIKRRNDSIPLAELAKYRSLLTTLVND